MRKLAFLVPIFWLLTTTPARADFDAGMAAYERSDFELAMREWLPLAKAGDAEAQYRIGRLFDRGEGVEVNYEEAFAWNRKAANQGHIVAMYNLGVFYREGEGTFQDYAQSAAWFRKAAERGHREAQSSLGMAYYDGSGLSQDTEKAFRWFHRAAAQGDKGAQGMAAYCYLFGEGVPRDPSTGFMWYLLSLEAAHWEKYLVYPIIWTITTRSERQNGSALAKTWTEQRENH